MTKTAFVVAMVGSDESPERRRADEIYEHVLKPVFDEFGLEGYRADMDATPGSITERLISQLVRADLVVVDLTGMNPNVFYELGVAHSFGKRVIAIADNVSNLPFDNKDQRTIPLGDYPESGLPVRQADTAKENIRRAAQAALDESFEPISPVKGAAGIASLDQLAEEDPVASELAQIREDLNRLGNMVARALPRPRSSSDKLARLVAEAIAERPHAVIDLEDFVPLDLPEDDMQWLSKVRALQVARRDRERRESGSDGGASVREKMTNEKHGIKQNAAGAGFHIFESDNDGYRP